MPINVFLIDDHKAVLESLCLLLEMEENIRVAGAFPSGAQALKYVEQIIPDLVVIDLNLPGEDGLDIARKIKQSAPQTHIIMLSMDEGTRHRERAWEAGVNHWLSKDESPENIIKMIKTVTTSV